MARIAIVSNSNGVGLTRDIEILQALLKRRGHAASYVHWQALAALALDSAELHAVFENRFDLAVHVEVFDPANFVYAKKHVGVFNLEWFESGWAKHLEHFDQLWAKSASAFEWFQERHLDQARFTGFASRDMCDPTVERERRVLHVRGASEWKGTRNAIAAWQTFVGRHPRGDRFKLTIVSRDELHDLPSHIALELNPDDDRLRYLMNSHAIHLCPSIVEGWGHYIAEGISCGAHVITTDASPMNEHVLPSFGHLLPVTAFGLHNEGATNFVAIEDIVDGIERSFHRSFHHPVERQRAREHFLTRNSNFELKASRALEELGL